MPRAVFNQGELVSGPTRTLYCSGQTAMSSDGEPEHDGDMAGQLALSVDNLEAVLGGAGMSLADLVRLTVYTTDVDLLLQHYGVLASRLGAARVAPTTTMLGGWRTPASSSSWRGPPSPERAGGRHAGTTWRPPPGYCFTYALTNDG